MSSTSLDGLSELGNGPDTMIAISVAFLAISWTSVTLRVFVRAFMIRAFGWDDWVMLVTLVSLATVCRKYPAAGSTTCNGSVIVVLTFTA